ncbi:hypothetical protein ACHAXT_010532 [Thalassiosira profunda]
MSDHQQPVPAEGGAASPAGDAAVAAESSIPVASSNGDGGAVDLLRERELLVGDPDVLPQHPDEATGNGNDGSSVSAVAGKYAPTSDRSAAASAGNSAPASISGHTNDSSHGHSASTGHASKEIVGYGTTLAGSFRHSGLGSRMSRRRMSRRASHNSSVGSGPSRRGSTGSGTGGTLTTTEGSKAKYGRRSSSMEGMWSRLGRRSDAWEDMSDLGEDEDEDRRKFTARDCWGACGQWARSAGRWWKATLKTAFKTPGVWVPCLVMFVAIVVGGMLITYAFETSEGNARKEKATAIAEQTDLFFVRVLENAFVPLFTMAQFVKELPEFHLLDQKVGDRCEPSLDAFNCTQSAAAPPLSGKEETHRDMNVVFDTEYGRMIQKKFDSIASGIKANSGLGKSLANIQLAPKGVVSMLYPMVNCDDFEDGYCMNNTGAWGHDLLNDPNRVGIARATVPAEGVVTAGPLKIIQGEDTFIARLAINFPDGSLDNEGNELKHSMVVDEVEYPCWGFAVVLLNWQRLKQESNIYKEFAAEKMQFKLTRTDVKPGEAPNVVTIAESPNSELIEDDNITLALDTGDNGWVMAVGYDDGFTPNYKKVAYPIIFVGAFALTVLLMVTLVTKREHEQLLMGLMPRRAIKKLAKGETVVDRYPRVTIFFSDIVGYTRMSSEMTPIEVMDLLNALYSRFDALAKKHDVFKVETIGDAYVAVAGAPKRCSGPQAAEKMTLFALDCLQTVKDFETDDGATIAIRVGLASGAVVAGVVGSSLPKYTLFGDTVNLAARMEQTSRKMKLQICHTTHRMLIDAPGYQFEREERVDDNGELGVECKGKGRQHTYWVTSATKLKEGDVKGEVMERRDTDLVANGGEVPERTSSLDIEHHVVDEEDLLEAADVEQPT